MLNQNTLVQADSIIHIPKSDTSTPKILSHKSEREGRIVAYPDNNFTRVILSMNPIIGLRIILDLIPSSANYGRGHFSNGFIADNSSTTTLIPLDQNERWIQQKSSQLLSLLRVDDVESGIASQSETFVKKALAENRILALQMVNQVYNDNVGNPHIQIGILHLCSHIEYSFGSPTLQTIALAALNDKNDDVKDYAVQCFENWNHRDGLRILKTIHSDTRWLQSYIDSVIESLSEICLEADKA
jgi:hypothetical protein